ncbi:phosphotransferase family protein [Kineococcus sp. NBC_00420]|uniref:phosphotransferase family protein n=1 Tax=Kineococcus sp. NBC_00420 TaxID=2903564 RepID=UPI002E20698E
MTLDQLRSRLATYLSRPGSGNLGASPGPLQGVSGGWASSLYTFDLRRGEHSATPAVRLVLKTYAPDDDGRVHAAREWRALEQLRTVDYPVPRGVLLEFDTAHLGRPFVVMEHVAGVTLWQAHEAADPSTQAQLVSAFATQLAALHALDPRLLEPTATDQGAYDHIDRELTQLHHDSDSLPRAGLSDVLRWLHDRRHLVPCRRSVVLHRDYHPWNVLVDGSGRPTVLDWDWRIGDPRFDLAWTSTLMQRSGFDAFARAVRGEYAVTAAMGDPLEGFAYFEVLTTVRWLLNVLPSIGPTSRLNAATRAEFSAFLVRPVREARELLRARAEIDVEVQVQT